MVREREMPGGKARERWTEREGRTERGQGRERKRD